jgi:hypothetical protein
MTRMHHHDARVVVDRYQRDARRHADAHRLASQARPSAEPESPIQEGPRTAPARTAVLRGKAVLVAALAPLAGLLVLMTGGELRR